MNKRPAETGDPMHTEQSSGQTPRHSTLRRRAWVAMAAAAVAAIVAAVLLPLSAQAATVALSGTVATTANVKLAGVGVTAYQDNGTIGALVGSTTTTSAGAFSFGSLPTGSYTLHFGTTPATYAQYLGETTDPTQAQLITLSNGGGNHAYVNAVLDGSGTIGGSVKTTANVALSGYTVRAYPDGGDESTPVLSATTSATGAYAIAGLQPGSYRLEAIDTAATAAYAPAFSEEGRPSMMRRASASWPEPQLRSRSHSANREPSRARSRVRRQAAARYSPASRSSPTCSRAPSLASATRPARARPPP